MVRDRSRAALAATLLVVAATSYVLYRQQQRAASAEDGTTFLGGPIRSLREYAHTLYHSVMGSNRRDNQIAFLCSKTTRTSPKRLTVASRTQLTHDTYLFEMAFEPVDNGQQVFGPEHIVSGLPIGNHVKLIAGITDSTFITRPYTPISLEDQKGSMTFLIKVYPDGLMTNYLKNLPIGASIQVSGPFGLITYCGDCNFEIRKQMHKFSDVLFIAGGTGITPCFSVIQASLDAGDALRCNLLFANKSPDDILMKEQLDTLSSENPDKFRVFHTVDKVPEDSTENWDQGVGYITEKMITDLLPVDEDMQKKAVMICGPPGMVRHVNSLLSQLKIENVFSF